MGLFVSSASSKYWNRGVCSPLVLASILSMSSMSVLAIEDDDLMELSLQDLLDVDVTSVSKKAEKRSEAAAAIYSISNEDIRRSTAKTIPDLLRTVPGVNVAQIDAHTWSVTVRGQGGEYATKLLVLVDGRSVYTPFFSGVFWDTVNLVLEDVDRIEIIRGPGGALWGANAVNGVINIVTKSAEETQGGLVSVAAGDEIKGELSLRYGDVIGDDHFYRVYFKGTEHGESDIDFYDLDANDSWEQGRGGIRYDHDIDDAQHITFQSDYFSLSSKSNYFIPEIGIDAFTRTESKKNHTGFNALGRWTNKYNDTNEVSIQAYVDTYHYDSFTLDEERETFDIEFQHHKAIGERHDIVWGLGYRYSADSIDPTDMVSTNPSSDNQDLFSLFIQDDIQINEEFRLTLGTKLEHNKYTEWEIQPTIRASWLPTENQTVWAAASRSVRTPNRAENDIRLRIRPIPELFNLPTTGILFGQEDFDSTDVISYEAGYRQTISENLMLDIAVFYNDYEGERSYDTDFPNIANVPAGTLPLKVTNEDDFETKGVEVTLDYRPIERWTIRTNYSYLDSNQGSLSENTPDHQASLSNFVQVTDALQFDTSFRYAAQPNSLDIVDDYFTLDARVAWSPKESLTLSLNGRNLLDAEHIEYVEFIANRIPTGVERSIYGQITWEF
jgi:iron complex outermembrane recepter protein